MIRHSAVLLSALAVLLVSAPASSSQSATPTDPAALLDSARQKNGLTGPDIRPWHIHGTYQIYNEKGHPEDEGIYEEWWLTPTKYKISFASTRFTQTDYADGTSVSRDGAQEWPNGFELALREQLINPVPPADLLADMNLAAKTNNQLRCVSMIYPLRENVRVAGDSFPAACFELASPVLRISSSGSSRYTAYNNLVVFQGHYLAKQLQVFQSGKLRAELNLDVVEILSDPSTDLLTPSPTAKPLDPDSISFQRSSFGAFPMGFKKIAPVYPLAAKSLHIVGTVKLRASVDSNGHVRSTSVIEGPEALRESAEKAVTQWTYRPLVVLGIPRSFQMEIWVIFTLG